MFYSVKVLLKCNGMYKINEGDRIKQQQNDTHEKNIDLYWSGCKTTQKSR